MEDKAWFWEAGVCPPHLPEVGAQALASPMALGQGTSRLAVGWLVEPIAGAEDIQISFLIKASLMRYTSLHQPRSGLTFFCHSALLQVAPLMSRACRWRRGVQTSGHFGARTGCLMQKRWPPV